MCFISVVVFCVTISLAGSVPQNNGLRVRRSPMGHGSRWKQGLNTDMIELPPAMHRGPPSNRGPPDNRGPPNNRGPPANRGPPNNRGPPANRGPPNKREPPDANQGQPDNQGPLGNRGPPENREPMNDRWSPQNGGTPDDIWQSNIYDFDNSQYSQVPDRNKMKEQMQHPFNIGNPMNNDKPPKIPVYTNTMIAEHITNNGQGQALANNYYYGNIPSSSPKPPVGHFFQALPVTPEE